MGQTIKPTEQDFVDFAKLQFPKNQNNFSNWYQNLKSERRIYYTENNLKAEKQYL